MAAMGGLGQTITSLRYPSMHAEIVLAVDDLAKPFEPVTGSSRSRFLEIYLLLYEEASVSGDPRFGVGWFLKTTSEAQALATLRNPLQAVIDDGGPHATDAVYQGLRSWRPLVDAARSAVRAFEDSTPSN